MNFINFLICNFCSNRELTEMMKMNADSLIWGLEGWKTWSALCNRNSVDKEKRFVCFFLFRFFFFLTEKISDLWFSKVHAKYCEEWRYYHNFGHIAALLRLCLEREREFADLDSVLWAVVSYSCNHG